MPLDGSEPISIRQAYTSKISKGFLYFSSLTHEKLIDSGLVVSCCRA